jgi:hypothetical protein
MLGKRSDAPDMVGRIVFDLVERGYARAEVDASLKSFNGKRVQAIAPGEEPYEGMLRRTLDGGYIIYALNSQRDVSEIISKRSCSRLEIRAV